MTNCFFPLLSPSPFLWLFPHLIPLCTHIFTNIQHACGWARSVGWGCTSLARSKVFFLQKNSHFLPIFGYHITLKLANLMPFPHMSPSMLHSHWRVVSVRSQGKADPDELFFDLIFVASMFRLGGTYWIPLYVTTRRHSDLYIHD